MVPRCYIYNTLGTLPPWQGGAEGNPATASWRREIRQLLAPCAERLQEGSAAVGNPSNLIQVLFGGHLAHPAVLRKIRQLAKLIC